MEKELTQLISQMKLEEAEKMAICMINNGVSAKEIYQQVMDGLNEVGIKYEKTEYFIADLIVSGMLAKDIFSLVDLYKDNELDRTIGTVLIGTILDDIHDIGKDLMIDSLRAQGIHVIDLGVDVKIPKFVDSIRQYAPDIIAVSCIMTSSVGNLHELAMTLQKEGLLENRGFIIGGAAANRKYLKIPYVTYMTNNLFEGVDFCVKYLANKGKGMK